MTQRQVTLEGGAPWGFRMHGGVDLKTPLKVSRVNPGSKASQRGVREGDVITSINDENTRNLTNNEAHNLLKRSGSTLKLGLNEVIEGSPEKRQYRTIHHETHQETVKRSSISYTLKETIERSSSRKPNNNEFEAFKSNEFINGKETKQNGRGITVVTNIPVSQKSTPSSSSASTPSTLVTEGKNISSDHAIASRQSSYSNCSSIPDEGSQRENQDYPGLESQEMNDGDERMSKSKKRRQRRKNLLNRTTSHESQTQSDVETEEPVLESNSAEKCSEIVLEPASKNLEILRLKRIEHKYKVESPKELRLDQIKSREKKKLKAKSKSLDDDDLKIQELSEASESEDTKYQSNVIISEASSEENLLTDSDSDSLRKKRSLASISFQLNDDNQLEATSLISPEEEQALRNFLGGLNLVNSPEESAKDLYERTTGLNDPKSKKLQKRKELEEYFVPIAQNPRYLDAISEEASDISDKECSGLTKKVQHIKQSTPENDLGQSNSNKETVVIKPILIEAKILETLEEGICSTNVVPTSEEKAEVVYLPDDSSVSSNLSNDSDDTTEEEDLVNKTDEESYNKQVESDSKSNVAEDAKELKNTKIDDATNKRFDFHIGSEETISTVVSSHTSSSTKISDIESTNDKVSSGDIFSKSDKNSDAKVIFDYTKVPNILKEKEPAENGAKGTQSKESLGVKNEKAVAENSNKKDSKLDKVFNNTEDNAMNSKVFHSEARSISAVHMSKKMVNGHIDNAECRKVKVDEICKNGDVEVKKDFEEFTTKSDKVINGEISNTSSIIKKTDSSDADVTNLDSKSESALKKESINPGLDTSSNLKPSSTKTEIDNIQNSAESREVLADELSKKEKVRTTTENTSKINEVKTKTIDDLADKSCNFINHESIKETKNEFENSTVSKEANGSTTSKNEIIKSSNSSSENCISESKKESVLRHVIMTSQDSNKTDSQKLLEFESIWKLNSELKDKISRQDLIGPAFRKSKSPATDVATSVPVVMSCEEDLPTKSFIQKRVKEFSQENCKVAEERKHSKMLGPNTVHHEACISPEPSQRECRSLIASRVRTFSNKLEQDFKSENEESILKKIIMSDDKNNNCVKLDNQVLKDDVVKQNEENIINLETIIPVTVDNDDEDGGSQKEGSILKRILSCHAENKSEKYIKEEANNEIIIPVTIEHSEHKETIIPIQLETLREKPSKPTVEKIIPISLEKNKSETNKVIVKVATKTCSKERLIPIEIKNDDKETVKEQMNEKPNDLTKESIKNISKSLINLVEKKQHKKEDNSTAQEIKTNNKTITIEPKMENKNEPPIPPPRRSKALLLKQRQETLQKIPNKEDIPVSSDITYTNVISPPRPASASSDSSCSEESSSRCTAKYNPNSSIADVASITKDEEIFEPMSLRNIVLKVLMSLPFGGEILKELAEVSKTIEHFTNKLPFKGVGKNDKNNVVLEPEENMPGSWYTQKDVARNSYEDERRKIIELHQKFLTRRKYSEDSNTPQNVSEHDRVQITAIGNRESQVTSPNRLLTIIREEPELSSDLTHFEDNSDQRLKAKNLGEWLTLARNKSKSTSNLDSTIIPINNLRRTIASAQNEHAKFSNTRRFSLPQEIYEKQLIDIMEKEREIQRELEKLEEEKMKLRAEIAPSRQKEFQVDDFYVSKKGDFAEIREDATGKKERPASMPVFPTEYFRQQMYEEYMDKFSEREERKQQKVIKISSSNDLEQEKDKPKEIIHPIEIEQEFMDRVKEKLRKNHVLSSDESFEAKKHDEVSSKDEAPVIVLDGDKVKGIETLPRHLQEFVDDLTTLQQDDCIWSPGQPRRPPSPPQTKQYQRTDSKNSQSQNDPVSPIWTPKSANSSPTVERKEFRPVTYVSPVLSRKIRTRSESIPTPDSTTSGPPWKLPEGASDGALNLSSTLDRRLPTSQSSPGFGSFSTSPRLPKAQNPTITLLQKAREGQLPRGAHYIDQDRRPPNDRPPIKYPGEVLYHIKNEYTSESDSERPRKMADLTPKKFEGIGPTTKDGMPLILRSEVKDKDQSKWYKRMYDTIHKQKPHRDEYVTVRYKQKRAQYPYTSGYLSEPEPGAYDSDFTDYKYQTLDRRRTPQTQHYISNHSTMPRSVPDNRSYSSSDIIKNTQEKYNNLPGRIENYRPGHSSISEKEAKQWWDEVMDIFDGHLEQQSRVPPLKPRSFINQALKESGYESDSTLVFKRKEETAANQLGPKEQREAYKIIQKGGDVPFQGLRKPAPERPKEPDLPPPPPPPKSQGGVRSQEQESPRKYVENEVTIHYKTPVRTEIKEYVSEDELAHRQAEIMKKIYEEERKRKYLQELQDMKSRRHTDNFVPSQKSPISLTRYDDFDDLTTPTKTRTRSPEPRLVAKALFNFVGQTARELTFRKGDLIYVRRQVDKNWYEGELNAMVGLFPVNYVEIVPYEGIKTTPRKAHEGQARAKYNFVAQTHLELSLAKGELVTITRRVDDNWFEGKIGGRKGIFPVAYVDVLIDPSDPLPPSTKPVASPAAHSMLLNGSAQGKESMGSHLYTPNLPTPVTNRDNGYHHAKPVQLTGSGTYSTLPKKTNRSPIEQALHIETQAEPVPYRALYKYTPQNDDELELLEGDTVYVLEKCDDGWYVGSSDRTGAFGTFPGNYVEKI